MDKLV